MEETAIVLERHEQKIQNLEQDILNLREVQHEIKSMNEALITLTSEIKHTNEHLAMHDEKIDELNAQPRQTMQQILTAIISALAGAVVTAIISYINFR